MDDEGSAQKASRDYTFEVDGGGKDNNAPLISVFGGKITTYRKLAEAATDKICTFFPNAGPEWTKHAPLPGGNFTDWNALVAEFGSEFRWLPEKLAKRYARTYGTRTYELLRDCSSVESLGQLFGGNLYAAEVEYVREHEWAISAEDIVWRRTKQGLRMKDAQVDALQAYLEQNPR
jgi:glycerol-3-phosphate dehydrogenase